MKTKLKYICLSAAAGLTLSLSSCSDFMDLTPEDQYDEATVWSDADLAKTVVNDVYSYVCDIAQEVNPDAWTDDAFFTHVYGCRDINEATVSPSNLGAYDRDDCPFKWSKQYKGIYRANLVLANIDNVPEKNGVMELREAIADHLQHFRGMNVNPDNIIVGAGTEYLYSIIVQLLGRDKVIAVEDPGYKKIANVYESNGVKCLHIKIDQRGIQLNELVESKADAVHISPSHQFPTGRVMPISRRTHLLKWAINNKKYIIEDDYDSEFRFSGKPIPPIAGMEGKRVIYMNTFSKTLAPSIRIAYMVLPDELMDKFNTKLGFYSNTVSGFEQYTLANFISKGYYERHINRMRNYYRDYRNKIIRTIQNHPIYSKVSIEEENSGLHFILNINKKIDDEQFKKELQQNNINISGVSDYCYNNLDEFKHKFIINYSAVSEENLKKALDVMNEALSE